MPSASPLVVKMPRTLIIAYGNPLRGDDGLGWEASRLLAEDLEGEDVEILQCHVLTPDLTEAVSQVELAIFIDAGVSGTPGSLTCQELRESSAPRDPLSHQLDPSSLPSMAKILYGKAPKSFLLSIAGESFGFGEGLSPLVAARLPSLVETAKHLVTAGDNASIMQLP